MRYGVKKFPPGWRSYKPTKSDLTKQVKLKDARNDKKVQRITKRANKQEHVNSKSKVQLKAPDPVWATKVAANAKEIRLNRHRRNVEGFLETAREIRLNKVGVILTDPVEANRIKKEPTQRNSQADHRCQEAGRYKG